MRRPNDSMSVASSPVPMASRTACASCSRHAASWRSRRSRIAPGRSSYSLAAARNRQPPSFSCRTHSAQLAKMARRRGSPRGSLSEGNSTLWMNRSPPRSRWPASSSRPAPSVSAWRRVPSTPLRSSPWRTSSAPPSSGSTPTTAVIAVGALIAALVLVGNVRLTWSFSAFTVLVYYSITNLAALRLPADKRLYPPWIAVLGLLGCLLLAAFVELRVLVGRYAQAYYLNERGSRLTDWVRDWKKHLPGTMLLPHPSPRNNRWLVRNPWFEEELVPALRERVSECLSRYSDTERRRYPLPHDA